MRVISGAEEVLALEGAQLGTSDWLTVTQSMIDEFAATTGDRQWIHVDPERAANGPFGTTIAHGFLTLSLLPSFLHQVFEMEGFSMAVNYGLDRVRFLSPVPVGSNLRGQVEVAKVVKLEGAVQLTLRTTIEVENSTKPACVVDSIGRYYA